LYTWPMPPRPREATMFAMSTQSATARFLLFPQVGQDVREAKAVKIRRYRLTRVDVNPPSSTRKRTFEHLKRTHD
jgi:hypothetical protein